MPRYNGEDNAFSWGYSFDEMVDIIAMTLQDALQKHGRKSCVLHAHDWGAVLAMLLQRKYPGLVHGMVLHDVAFFSSQVTWRILFMLGFVYQWWLATAFLVSSIPVVGPSIGDAMTWALTKDIGAPLGHRSMDRKRISGVMNYFYWYFSVYYFAERFGLISGYDVRNGISSTALVNTPTLFIFASTLFHPKGFEKEMRDRADCDAIRLTSANAGHWYIYEQPEEAIPLVQNWLQTRKTQGNYSAPLTGF
eukprot:CAMPEP_0185905862 /NCGR_PEP_ID=MMETSP0196C-20130402/5022_1 /TAXON_ID=2932 /ORGANISM="Alexandrium fundyense, Strain CCMP1719" /LENGTH=248 /DNA_ID=CAMNT_0028625481 /DNA_START=29 /DNA_END=775 /DNA_ORIENTATION=-